MFMIRDGPVHLVEGGGGRRVEEFVKEYCKAPKGHKKNCTHNIVKKNAKQNIKRCDLTVYTV